MEDAIQSGSRSTDVTMGCFSACIFRMQVKLQHSYELETLSFQKICMNEDKYIGYWQSVLFQYNLESLFSIWYFHRNLFKNNWSRKQQSLIYYICPYLYCGPNTISVDPTGNYSIKYEEYILYCIISIIFFIFNSDIAWIYAIIH